VKENSVALIITSWLLKMPIYTLLWVEPVVENAPTRIIRRPLMPRNLKTLAQLQTQINQLKSENQQLRLLFRVIIDVAYQAVNGKEENEPKKAKEEDD
jgi:hypothetical protein